MTKIFLLDNATKVWFEASGSASSNYKLMSLHISTPTITEGKLIFRKSIDDVPDQILESHNSDKKLKTWEKAVESVQDESRRHAAAALDKLYQDLRKCALKADGSNQNGVAADFLGITGIAKAETEFHIEINPIGLLPSAADDSNQPIFRAVALASFTGQFESPFVGVGRNAVVRIEVILSRESALKLLSRVEVPELPHFGLTFPELNLPQWSLGGLELPISNLKFFEFPFQESLNATVTWTPNPTGTPNPTAKFSIIDGKLNLVTKPSNLAITLEDTQILTATNVKLTVDDMGVKISADNIIGKAKNKELKKDINLDNAFEPLLVKLSSINVGVIVAFVPDNQFSLMVTLNIGRILIQARTDPSLVLALAATVTLTYKDGVLTPKLDNLEIVEPYPIKLALVAAHVIDDGIRRLLSLIQKIEIPVSGTPSTPDLPSVEALRAVLKRIAALVTAAATWLAQQGIAAARTLAGLAEAVLKLLGEVIAELADKIKEIGGYVIVEVRIDINRRRVVQIVVTPSDPNVSTARFTRNLLGFKLTVPYQLSPALVCDFDENWMAIVLQTKAGDNEPVTLSTDLWLENDKTGTTEPVSGSVNAKPVDEPLLTLTVTRKKGGQDNDRGIAIALAGIENGKAFFLNELVTQPSETDVVKEGTGTIVANGHLVLAANFVTLKPISSNNFDIVPTIDTNRILSLFRSAGPSTDNQSGDFSQSIKIVKVGEYKLITIENPPEKPRSELELPVDIEIKISDETVQTTVAFKLNLETLSVKLNAGRFDINLKDDKFELLGLKGNFVSKNENSPELILDLSDGDPRLSLNEEVRLNLTYDKLSNSGEGLGFSVDQFVVSRDGIDLTANVMNDKAVTLAGVDMPFRFDHGQLSIRHNRIQTFTITGHGNLPSTLVGEAKASIELNFAQGNNRLILQAAKAVLDKTADPLRCENTQFSITVTKLGLKFVEQDGYHFYFTLTGAAEFRPNSGAFADGLLKNLSSLNIVLNEAPLASDPRVLLKHIEFLVPVDPPKRSSFFDLFSFELRGVGFHPASDAFGGSPAFSIAGQVNFTDFGDIVTPRFDFHKLWIAPPENGQALPRIRFDGLGVGLALGSMAEASGTAIAVDGKLPSLLKHDALTDKEDVTAKGFLASGSLRIQGWASMSASMGFLELEKPGINDKRHAFFIYLQRNDMAEKIPTPIGTIFLREVGFGFGYRYTLAGIAAADKAETPRELIKVLDEISKYQGSLDDVRAWLPTFDNAALTLALRGLLSITSASSTTGYNEKGEKDLPNLILFDIVAALRTDLTFLMNVRAWVAYNYADWREARQKNSAWRNNPNLTGYMYLSAPRREFLARAVSNPGAEVGNHPDLPKQLKDAMKVVRWSSTLYVRPGLFHWEAGWPYELGFSIGKPEEKFYLVAEGGTVMRFEESAVLYGLAFRARGFAKFDYSTGGSFGAAISARAEFALGAKLIAYLSTNMSESMFYGVITLDVTVVFAVRMWLKTKWFKLSTSFSQSLTIHVGIELLLESSHLAARIEASVSVGAFGRTLSVGIGFTLGDIARLDMARLRVERFLSLGLASSYPDPEAGVSVSRPAPLPEPSRGENASKSDHRTENTADRVERTKCPEQDEEDLLKIVGRKFGDVHYWALLFPIRSADDSKYYLVQLIPCDASFGCNDDLLNASHFYAAPKNIDDTHTYSVSGVREFEIFSKAPPQKVQKDGKDYWEIFTDWTAPFGFHGAGENARERAALKEVFEFGCFMAGLGCVKVGDTTICDFDLTDIETIPWDKDEILPDDPEQASIKLKEAARSRAECGPKWKRILQIEEARSCFIATVADCAERLAGMVSIDSSNNKLTIENKRVEELEFDPRAIGLTFVLEESRLKKLFCLNENDSSTEPPESDKFFIKTRIPKARIPKDTEQKYSEKTPVRLFNPPERMFHQLSPVLKYSPEEQRASAKGILLHWDLEPRWASSKSIYSDPEYHLKHYRIERRIEGLIAEPEPGLRIAVPPPRVFEVKKSDPIEIVLAKDDKNEEKQLHKRRYRSRLQFADDLQDLDEKLRAQLLTPVNSDDRSLVKKGKNGFIGKDTRIVYSVLPVDCCGTYGVPEPDIVIPIKKREEAQKSLLKAIARFQYENVPDFDETFNPRLVNFLQFTIEEEEKQIEDVEKQLDKIDHDKSPELEEASNFQLRIRSERTVAVGVFGVDALSQARVEPPVPGREERQPSAGDIDVTLNLESKCKQSDCEKELVNFTHKFLIKITRIPRRLIVGATSGNVLDGKEETALYSISTRDWEKLQDALDISSSARVQAARLYIRPQPKSAETATEQHHLDPEWIPVQLQMQFFPKTTDTKPQIEIKEPAFDITVERFEHPLNVNFHALTSGNIFPSSGRLYLYHPAPCATLQDFIADNENNVINTVIPLRDGDRRTAVTLAWNARPADIGLVKKAEKDATENATDLHSLIAGYDLFALDATAVPKNAKDHPDWPERFIASIGRVQRLPAAERGQEPSETGDFSRIEVLYPSETWRLNTASSGKRRATWFSPAESCLIWPKRVLRRSVLALPDEVDIASLFVQGRPARIMINWVSDGTGRPIGWPADLEVPDFAVLYSGKSMPAIEIKSQNNSLQKYFSPENVGDLTDNKFTVEKVRQLLLALVVYFTEPKKFENIDKHADEQPSAFANLKIILTACDKNGNPLGARSKGKEEPNRSDGCVLISLSLAPKLHPILADVLDLIQYENAASSYRRYEPVLDTAPAVNADTLNAFLDETAADRDPSGWGVLRTLGLAAAFRLYDVEEGRFLLARETLPLLNDALKRVLPRYKDAPQAIGAPFVDVMFTTDGLAETSSYHGATPIKPNASAHLRDNALALVQIELRPIPQPLVIGYEQDRPQPKERRRIIRYATLKLKAAVDLKLSTEGLTLSAKKDPEENAPKENVLIEIEPLVRTKGQTTRQVLLMKGEDRKGQKFPTEQSADTISSALQLQPEVCGTKDCEQDLAYIRFIALGSDVLLDDLNDLVEIKDSSGQPVQGTSVVPAHDLPFGFPEDDKNNQTNKPWGRFADLPGAWLAELLFEDGLKELPKGNAEQKKRMEEIQQRIQDMPCGDTLATLMRILGRIQDKSKLGEIPDTPAKRLQLATSLGPWMRRFMERGPAVPLKQENIALGQADLAFAMLTRPNPWRLAADSKGRLSVMLFEKDRFGKMRKYAIRPFGRYENLVHAVELHKQAAEAKAEKTFAPMLSPPRLDKDAFLSDKKNSLRQHFADVVVERTEPLAAPVIIAARRNDVTKDGATTLGNSVEVIVSRHPEEILSDANIQVDAGLAMRHIAVGFWREFAAPKWAEKIDSSIDIMEPFGPFKDDAHDYSKLPKPRELQLANQSPSKTDDDKTDNAKTDIPAYHLDRQQLRDWYERHPDLWRGSYVLRLADMPYGFRLHATAHAAAGVVVSPTTVATIGEAGYQLVLPWKADGKADSDNLQLWQNRKVTKPSWQLIEDENDNNERKVSIRWPLVRIIDGMMLDAKSFWFGEENAPDVYRLPDPAVSYRLSIETKDGRVRVGEAEISAISEGAKEDKREDLYLAQAIGARFGQPEMSSVIRAEDENIPTHYELEIKLKLSDSNIVNRPPKTLEEPLFSVATPNPVPHPKGLAVGLEDMQHWGLIAPAGRVSLIITPPDKLDNPDGVEPHPDWTKFKVIMDQFIEDMNEYTGNGQPDRVKDTAAAIASMIKKYAVDTVGGEGGWPGPEEGPIAREEKLLVPWLLGLPAKFDHPHIKVIQLVEGWNWPNKPGEKARSASSRDNITDALIEAGASDSLEIKVNEALHNYAIGWMAHDIAQRQQEDKVTWHEFPPIRRAVVPNFDISNVPINNELFDFIVTIELRENDGRTHADVEAAFETLKRKKCTAETLESLVALWSEPTKRAKIYMRGSIRDTIMDALVNLTGGSLPQKVESIMLFRPMKKSETTLVDMTEELRLLLDDMTEELLFGPGRRLLIQAFHGLAKPQEDCVGRKEE